MYGRQHDVDVPLSNSGFYIDMGDRSLRSESQTSLPKASGRLLSVDVVRGLACLAVVFYHVGIFSHVAERPSPWRYLFFPFSFGSIGVTMFIVVSGFCIHLSVARKMAPMQDSPSHWGRFWKRRFLRLYPPYLAAIGLSVAIFYAIQVSGKTDGYYRIHSIRWDLLSHLLLVHNLFPDYNQGLFNGPFWSLGLEEQLYALYMIFLFLRKRLPFRALLLIVLGVSFAWNLGIVLIQGELGGLAQAGDRSYDLVIGPLRLGKWEDWPFGYWFPWVLGAVAAEAYLGYVKLPQWCRGWPSALMLTGLWLASHVSCSKYVYMALPIREATWSPFLKLFNAYASFFAAAATFVLLNWWMRLEAQGRFRGRLISAMAAVGFISYSIYLTHVPILRLAENFLPLNYEWPSILFRFLVGIPVTVALGYLFFLGVERRFLSRRQSSKAEVAG
jgi:peptidoglycan/LPS O-acetylase OafA/YrhL